jgi:DNA-binding phage protein
MRYKSHMEIGKVLRELIAKEGRSFRQTSIDLKVDRSTLHRSLKKGNPEWKTVEKVLDYLGYEIRIVRRRSKKNVRVRSK